MVSAYLLLNPRTHSGVCHSDMGVMECTWRGRKIGGVALDGDMALTHSTVPYPTQPGQVGGHEGVGVVHKLGPGNEKARVKLGDRVGIKASVLR
jgi:alcohol dehydrogenase, propanol-preferring